MGQYSFHHPKNENKVITLCQAMNDVHEYTDNKGVKWVRVWTVPGATIDNNIDPFSESAFLDKTKNTKGTVGNMLDFSKELSEKRAEKRDGIDSTKENYYKEYSNKRRGQKHSQQIKEQNAAKVITI